MEFGIEFLFHFFYNFDLIIKIAHTALSILPKITMFRQKVTFIFAFEVLGNRAYCEFHFTIIFIIICRWCEWDGNLMSGIWKLRVTWGVLKNFQFTYTYIDITRLRSCLVKCFRENFSSWKKCWEIDESVKLFGRLQ